MLKNPGDEPAVSDADTLTCPATGCCEATGTRPPRLRTLTCVWTRLPPGAGRLPPHLRDADGWEDDLRCALRFDGVESQASVGQRRMGGHGPWFTSPHEFDIADRVLLGRNTSLCASTSSAPGASGGSGPVVAARYLPIRQPAPPRPGSRSRPLDRHRLQAGVGYVTNRGAGARPQGLLVGRRNRRPRHVYCWPSRATANYRSGPQVGDVRPWNPRGPPSTKARVSINGRRPRRWENACVSDFRARLHRGRRPGITEPLLPSGVEPPRVRADEAALKRRTKTNQGFRCA